MNLKHIRGKVWLGGNGKSIPPQPTSHSIWWKKESVDFPPQEGKLTKQTSNFAAVCSAPWIIGLRLHHPQMNWPFWLQKRVIQLYDSSIRWIESIHTNYYETAALWNVTRIKKKLLKIILKKIKNQIISPVSDNWNKKSCTKYVTCNSVT